MTREEVINRIRSSPHPSFRDEDLFGADLSNINFLECDFSYAKVSGCNFSGCIFVNCNFFCMQGSCCNFEEAVFDGCNFYSAVLRRPNFISSKVNYTSFFYATLSDADWFNSQISQCTFQQAWLFGAKNFPPAAQAELSIAPEGDLIGWYYAISKGKAYIVELSIPSGAKRTSSLSRRCRCDSVRARDISPLSEVVSPSEVIDDRSNIAYKIGRVFASGYDADPFNDLGDGLYFFLTRSEAERAALQRLEDEEDDD